MKKTIDARIVQTLVKSISDSHGNTARTKLTNKELTATLKDLHSEEDAVNLIVQVMNQAILQGHAKKTTREYVTEDGETLTKSNDTTSNWKRDLGNAYNKAYFSKTHRLTITTEGKGLARAVGFKMVEKPAKKEGRELFVSKLEKLIGETNPTSSELTSITANILGLYDAEQTRVSDYQAQMKADADKAKLDALAAVTAQVSAHLEAQGIKATKTNIQTAMAMQAFN